MFFSEWAYNENWHKYVRWVCELLNTAEWCRDFQANYMYLLLENKIIITVNRQRPCNHSIHAVHRCMQTDWVPAANLSAHKVWPYEFSAIHTFRMTVAQTTKIYFRIIMNLQGPHNSYSKYYKLTFRISTKEICQKPKKNWREIEKNWKPHCKFKYAESKQIIEIPSLDY